VSDRGVPVISDDRWPEEAGELEPAVAVRRAHHGNLDMLIAQSSDTSGPFSFDRRPPFELEAEFAKEIDRPFEVLDDDSYVVHPFESHGSSHLSSYEYIGSETCRRGALVRYRTELGNVLKTAARIIALDAIA
jgi:hypothetical protein